MPATDLGKLHSDILSARDRIKTYVRKTPLEHSAALSNLGNAKVYIKLESEQVTGSFKARGAFNKCCILKESENNKDIYTSSTGNHALACNLAMRTLGLKGTIYVPETISAVKDEALKLEKVEVRHHGQDCVDAELKARHTAESTGGIYISPYNDWDVMAGQGTIGVEIFEELKDVNVVLVPVGGGGLIGGIAAYFKCIKPGVKIIGCQPDMSKVMYESIKVGKIVTKESYPTLSDGTMGAVEEGSVTFPVCQACVDDWIIVTEEDIAKGVYFMMERHHKIVEGAAGCAIGAYLQQAHRFKGQNVVLIACGANISMDNIKTIINNAK